MDGLRFASPWLLLLLAGLPLLALYAWPRRARAALPLGTLTASAGAARTWRIRLEPSLFALRIAAVALLMLAIARPQRGEAASAIESEGIDIVLAYDVSSSMTQLYASNVTRIVAAERVLSEFVASRKNDRVGLVVFQGSSITLSPLTTDYEALHRSVQLADTLTLADGTAIGVALGESVNVLRGSSAPSRTVILLTDGENNAGSVEPLAAARIAERLGVRVYTVGVVTRGFGPRSTLEVDETALERIAEVTGGTYSRAEDPAALGEVYDRIESLEKSRVEGRSFTRFDEFAPLLLALAATLLALEIGLRATAFRRAA